jgi:RHS repeat-associated protein
MVLPTYLLSHYNPPMVALAKAYRKTPTPSLPAQHSGHRFCSPEISRWLNRDRIQENGGLNIYVYAANSPIARWDALGLVSEEEVEDGEVVYSCNCGWIDLEHIAADQPAQILTAVANYNAGADGASPFIKVKIHQTAGILVTGIAADYKLAFAPGSLSNSEIIEYALAVYITTQKAFESHQGTLPGGSAQSSFAVEDLPSDYMGMMIAANQMFPPEGVSATDLMEDCKVLTQPESMYVFAKGYGLEKKYNCKPAYWKPKTKGDPCWPCKDDIDQPAWFAKYTMPPYGSATWFGTEVTVAAGFPSFQVGLSLPVPPPE